MRESDINWETLDRLRARFLQSGAPAGAYWQSEDDLAQYHATFAARIGWKWDNALADAAQAGFAPRARQLLDWGCGSGIATLRFLAHVGPDAIDRVLLWDHSLAACRFAQQTIRQAHPRLDVQIAPPPADHEPASLADTIVLVSHALNELSSEQRTRLARQLASAAQILVVEPGDHASASLLVHLREALRPDFRIIAPCTRCQDCPMLAEENARHWCHFFGKPPVDAFTEGFWARFGQAMEIDLRSLPYSFLALQSARLPQPSTPPPRDSRLIGRPRQFKGYTRLLSCDRHGLRELELQKRDDKALWKSLKKGPASSLFRWHAVEDGRIRSGTPL